MTDTNYDFTITIPGSTLAIRNNNPGNLRFAGQRNATLGEAGFARFESLEEGFIAVIRQVKLDASRGHTLRTFLNKYAPPSENDTRNYLRFVTQETGNKPDDLLTDVDAREVAIAICRMECGARVHLK